MFSIKMIGDWYRPLQWCLSKEHADEDGLSSGFNSEDLMEDDAFFLSFRGTRRCLLSGRFDFNSCNE